ncbi:MAG TPA: choice-of-anchor tandem repeat GloVer-containing protein [Bacteroidia bacterium]
MKKIYVVALIVIASIAKQAKAQYTKLLDFAGTTTTTLTANGQYPLGNLMQASDGMLYGMTYQGGADSMGILFQYNPATNILIDMLDFDSINGKYPFGSLMQASDGMLYGMTEVGGANNYGVLFQYNPATATYIDKFDFAAQSTPYGSLPLGSLMQANDGMMYGMTIIGGTSDKGVIFQYNPATSTYTKKFDFAGTNGQGPHGSLIQASDGMLYGITGAGGASGLGVLFQYNPATNTYISMFDFAGTNGQNPNGSLMQASDGMLYGMTQAGGASNMGVLFQYNLTTNTYFKMLDFNGTNGQNPNGSLMQANDGMLYGMTAGGGGGGVLFQYNPVTNTLIANTCFTVVTNGGSPQGDLMQASDGMLYGMTSDGGATGLGVLFKFCPPPTVTYTLTADIAPHTWDAYAAYSPNVVSARWYWGDGKDTMALYPSHTYSVAGTYSICVAAYSACGDSAISCQNDAVSRSGNNSPYSSMVYINVLSSHTTGITKMASSNEVSIYPNPASSSLQVTLSGNIQNTTLQITDMLGNTVKQSILYNPTSIINIADLAEGIYNISISSNEGVVNKRVVIAR